MKKMRNLGLILTLALALSGCQGAKHHYKSGKKYAGASMLKESVTSYKRAIDRKPNKVKYRIAIRSRQRFTRRAFYKLPLRRRQ